MKDHVTRMHYMHVVREEPRYLCNWSAIANPKYLTSDKNKVTCMNCRRILANYEDRLKEYEEKKNYFLDRKDKGVVE